MANSSDPESSCRFLKVDKAVNDELTQIYRDILETHVPFKDILKTVRNSNSFRTHRLQNQQLEKLRMTQSLGYKNLDVSLMYSLLRNLCPKITPPTNGWGKEELPDSMEITTGDDIERIRIIRNMIKHNSSSEMSENDFKKWWNEIKLVCQRQQQALGGKYLDNLSPIECMNFDDTQIKILKSTQDVEVLFSKSLKISLESGEGESKVKSLSKCCTDTLKEMVNHINEKTTKQDISMLYDTFKYYLDSEKPIGDSNHPALNIMDEMKRKIHWYAEINPKKTMRILAKFAKFECIIAREYEVNQAYRSGCIIMTLGFYEECTLRKFDLDFKEGKIQNLWEELLHFPDLLSSFDLNPGSLRICVEKLIETMEYSDFQMASGKETNPEETIASITSPDKKEDFMLIMNANLNWDRFFIPAPISISLLGELLLVSAERDISLREKCPEGGFTYLKYPDSLRACLVQISNSGWNAFNEAHNNMDQIRLQTSNVEIHIKYAVKILLAGSVKEVEKLLPLSLSKVTEIAESCKQLASSTEQNFIYVMQLTEEALEACTEAKRHYEEKDRETEIAIRVAKEQQRLSEESKKLLEEHYQKMEKEMSQAKDDFDSALKEMPSSFSLIKAFVVQGLVETLTNATSSILALKSTATVRNSNVLSSARKRKLPVVDEITVGTISRVLAYIKAIQALFHDNMPNMNEISKGSANAISQHLQKEKERLEDRDSEIHTGLQQCIDEAVIVCSDLIEYTKRAQHDDQKAEIIIKNYKSLTNKILFFESNIKKYSAYSMEPPSKAAKGMNSLQTLTEAMSENARIKTEMAKENLSNVRQKHDHAFEEMLNENERLQKTLVELQSLDLSKIEFEEIQRTLCKGIRALAEVREQWGKLCEFFQMISNIIKCCLKSSLQNFVDYSREGRDMIIEGDLMSSIYKDTIIEQATEANRVAFVVQSISTAYVEISSNYLMDGITSLGKLIPLHPKENEAEMVQKRAELHAMMERAQKAISNIMEKNKKEFVSKIEKRVNRIKSEVEAILPPIPEARIKEIQATVHEAYNEEQATIDQAMEDLF